jgi:hypothetical protein
MNRLERPRAVQRRKDPLPTGGSPMANPDSNRGHQIFRESRCRGMAHEARRPSPAPGGRYAPAASAATRRRVRRRTGPSRDPRSRAAQHQDRGRSGFDTVQGWCSRALPLRATSGRLRRPSADASVGRDAGVRRARRDWLARRSCMRPSARVPPRVPPFNVANERLGPVGL